MSAMVQAHNGDSYVAVPLRDKFPPDTPDTVWLHALAKESDWIIISGDERIKHVPAERKAWLDSRHIIFFLAKGWTNIPPFEQLSKLAKVFPDIIKSAERARRPAGFIIRVNALKIEPMSV